MTWCIVAYEDGGVQVVPKKWIKEDHCYWPLFEGPDSNKIFHRAVRECRAPDQTWELYRVRILGIYDEYEEARRKLKKAEHQSDLNTDDDDAKTKRFLRKRRVISSSEDVTSEDEGGPSVKDFPPPPSKSTCTNDVGQEGCNNCTVIEELPSQHKNYTRSDESPENQFSSNSDAFMERISKDIAYIKFNLKKLMEIVKNQNHCACKNKNTVDDDVREEIDEALFPLDSLDALHSFEKKLMSPEVKKKMILYLSRIGGFKIDEITKLILRKIFSDKLASLFSWEGKKKKKALSNLIIADVIRNAVHKSPNGTAATEADIILSIKNWLRHAPKRHENQRTRTNPCQEEVTKTLDNKS